MRPDHPARLQDERHKYLSEMEQLHRTLEVENRKWFRPLEENRFQFLKSELQRIDETLAKKPTQAELQRLFAGPGQIGDDDPVGTAERKAGNNKPLYRLEPKMSKSFSELVKSQSSMRRIERGTLSACEPPTEWVDAQSGETVELLSPHERLSNEDDDTQLHFGRLIRGLVTSKWNDADRERAYLAQSGNVNSAGGVLVADELAAGFIDKVRAKMVCLRAGAKTVQVGSDVLRIARVTADPTFTFKPENDPFPNTQVGFDAIQIIPRTIGAVVALSRELLEDCGNIVDLLESVLSAALAVKLDAVGLAGTGSAQTLGILNYPGVPATTGVGTLGWDSLQTAATAIRNANMEPGNYICSPTNQNRLASLVSGDGTNSAKLWLGPPPNVADIEQLVTTSMPDGSILMGDFSHMLLGVRSETRLEVSTEAGTAFQNHQALVKITTRWDVNIEHPEAFYILSGITG